MIIREIQIVGESPPKVLESPKVQDDKPLIPDGADYEEVLRRQDDIDQLTADYITAMVYPQLDQEVELEPDTLEMIENRFEEILANEFGIFIYRPAIVTRDDGSEVFVENIYDDDVDDEDFE